MQIHTRQEIFDRDLQNYLGQMLYAANGIKRELEFHENIAFSTEYIREKIRSISRACDALDHDMDLFQRRERQRPRKEIVKEE